MGGGREGGEGGEGAEGGEGGVQASGGDSMTCLVQIC